MTTVTLTDEIRTTDELGHIPITRLFTGEEALVAQRTPHSVGQDGVLSSPSQFEIQQSEDEKDYPTGAKLWLTIATLSGVLILGALDINIVATAVPSITNEFKTVADVGWYSSAFRLCTCAFQFIFAKTYKLFPVKRVFMASNAIFLVSSILCATATSSTMFVVGRAVSGIGFAGILSGCYIILTQILPLRRRPVFLGFMCGIESVAIVSAPIIGGALTQARGWRMCFWVNLPIAGAALVMTHFSFSDPKNIRDEARLPLKQKIYQLDLVSNMLLIPALTSLFIALSWAGVKYPWNDGKIVGLLIAFAILLAAFLYNQRRRGDSAALPPRILKNRSIVAGFIFSTLVNSVLNVLQYYLPIYYQIVRGYAPAKSGYMLLPIVAGDSIGAILHGSGTSLLGYYTPFMLFASVGMPISAGLITTFGPATTFLKLILCSAAAGFSTGIGYMGPQSAAQTVLRTEDAPLGLSIILFGSNFGPALFVAIAQVIFTNQLSTNLQQTVPGLSSAVVEHRGLGDIVSSVPQAYRADVIAGVSKSLSQTWYLAVALGAATMVGSLLMEWRSVKQKAE